MLIANNQTKKVKKKDSKTLKEKISKIGFKENISPSKIKKLKLSSQQWLSRQLNDSYVKASKRDGYYSRSAYKLLEINEKFNILRSNLKVIDLGAAPGGWSQVVSKYIFKKNSNNSTLISLDLLPINTVEGAILLQGDFTDKEVLIKLKDILKGEKLDLVLSDMAPNTIGMQDIDHIRIMLLVEMVYFFAKENLAKNGAMVIKVFQGGTANEILEKIKLDFSKVDHFKPDATRKESNEIYLIARGFKG